ncbi:MAG: hypothetical protein HY303_11680 [Candidatus Wallbacteria bacterium]|nr:hypothetical protein [Candidatus Wallbacteria bacterium]
MIVACAGQALAGGTRVTISLPPIASIDDLAWTPMPGERLLLTTDGEAKMTILDNRGQRAGSLFVPLPHIRDVRALSDGSLVLGDRRTGRIYHVKSDGPLLGSAGARGLKEGEFLQLDRVDADSRGQLYGLDGAELKILKFSSKGDLLGSFSVETGPVVDPEGRVLAVQDRLSGKTRRIVAYSKPDSHKVLYEGKLELASRWEPMAALSDGTVVVRTFDLSGACRVLLVGPDGKQGASISLADDAVLAGPARVLAVDPEEKTLVYLAGGAAGYRAIRVPLPR